MAYIYSHAALGGTFDLLHKGHMALLEKAFKIASKVSIGITTDKFCKEMGKIAFENQLQRRKSLVACLKTRNFFKRSKIVNLDDIYGTTLGDKSIDALVVSKETLPGAKLINIARTNKKLKIIITPQVLADDKKPITSGRIRNGEISRGGIVYKNALLKTSGRRFSEKIRKELKKPFGKIIRINTKLKAQKNIIAVGDASVYALLKTGIMPKISIVDFLVNRKPAFQNLSQLGFGSANPDVIVKNAPGQISKELIETVDKALKKNHSSVILVSGEEDLAVIPALLLAPLGSTIIYGQPKKGAVQVTVTPESKDKLNALL